MLPVYGLLASPQYGHHHKKIAKVRFETNIVTNFNFPLASFKLVTWSMSGEHANRSCIRLILLRPIWGHQQ